MASTAELCTVPRMKTLVEEVQKKYQEDVRYFAADRLARARCRREAKVVDAAPETISAHSSRIHTSGLIDDSGRFVSRKSPFASLKPKASLKTDKDFGKLTGKRQYTPIGDKPSSFHSTVTKFASTSVQVPSYKGYVSLSQNILAPNNKNVLVLPCFSDDQNDQELTQEMEEQFNMVNQRRHIENDYVERCWQLFPYAPYALEKARCNFADVVNYYAMSVEEFKLILNTNPQDYGLNAQQISNMSNWKTQAHSKYPAHPKLLARLPKSTPDALARTSALCQAWFKVFEALSFIAIQHFKSKEEFQEDAETEYRTLACRVCHVHECPYHGAMIEEEEDEADRDTSLNIRTHVTTGRRAQTDGDTLEYKSASHWKKLAPKASSVYDRPSFVPCSHEGCCEQAQCSCFEHEITCEKSCGCSKSCPRRFSGCSCSKQQKTCWNNPKCQCFSLSRECDPDLCFRCGASELLDSVSRGCDPDDGKLCQNVKIQSGIKKLTILGTSSIKDAGFGLYTVEAVSAGDYLGEYTGEIISHEEMLRREFYYQRQGLQYVFNLTGKDLEDDGTIDQAIDATRMGNEMRFINNAKQKFVNCTTKILMCNTVYRIGVFATRDIPPGRELFFHYGFDKEFEENYRDPETAWPNSTNSLHGMDSDDDVPLVKSHAGRKGKRKWSPSMVDKDRLSDDEYVDAGSDGD